jgi:hypothetical protein
MRILKLVALVVTGIGVPPENSILDDVGFETVVKYVVALSFDVMRTSESPACVPSARVTVSAVTLSEPVLVCRVKRLRSVILPDGCTSTFDGFDPSPIVVCGVVNVPSAEVEVPDTERLSR